MIKSDTTLKHIAFSNIILSYDSDKNVTKIRFLT